MTWLYDGYIGDGSTVTCIAREGEAKSLCGSYDNDSGFCPIREDFDTLWAFVRLGEQEDEHLCDSCVDALRRQVGAGDNGEWSRIVSAGGLPRSMRSAEDSEDEESEETLGDLFG